MEEIIGRIKEYMSFHKFCGNSLAKELDMSSVSVNQWLSGKRRMSWEFVSAILNHDEKLSSDWLTRGVGEMYPKKTDSNEYKELAEAKIKALVQEGIIKELKEIILEKNQGKIANERKSVVG